MLANRSVPRATVIPELPYPDVEQAIQWLCQTFGFNLRIQMGNHRAQLNVGQGAVVVTEPREGVGASSVLVRVEDVDAHHAHTLQSGAKIIREPATYPYGERQYTVLDFAGHRWTFTQSVADADPKDWGGTPGQL